LKLGAQPSRTPHSHRAAHRLHGLRPQAHLPRRSLKREPRAQHLTLDHQTRPCGARFADAVGDHRDGEKTGEGEERGDEGGEHGVVP